MWPNLSQSLVYHLPLFSALPSRRTCELWEDLLGQPLAEGTLQAALRVCANELAVIEAAIKQGVAQAAVGHFDETGRYVAGKRQGLHVASTAQLTHSAPHVKRGTEATTEIGILPVFGAPPSTTDCAPI